MMADGCIILYIPIRIYCVCIIRTNLWACSTEYTLHQSRGLCVLSVKKKKITHCLIAIILYTIAIIIVGYIMIIDDSILYISHSHHIVVYIGIHRVHERETTLYFLALYFYAHEYR